MLCAGRLKQDVDVLQCVEVERAAMLTRHVALGRTIEKVETSEDTIVYTGGITHTEFVSLVFLWLALVSTVSLFLICWSLGQGDYWADCHWSREVWQGVLYRAGWRGADAGVASWYDGNDTGESLYNCGAGLLML